MGGFTWLLRKIWPSELFKDLFQKEFSRGGWEKMDKGKVFFFFFKKKIIWAFYMEGYKCKAEGLFYMTNNLILLFKPII